MYIIISYEYYNNRLSYNEVTQTNTIYNASKKPFSTAPCTHSPGLIHFYWKWEFQILRFFKNRTIWRKKCPLSPIILIIRYNMNNGNSSKYQYHYQPLNFGLLEASFQFFKIFQLITRKCTMIYDNKILLYCFLIVLHWFELNF